MNRQEQIVNSGGELGDAFNRLPTDKRTIPAMLEYAAERYGDRLFATFPNGEMTFSDGAVLAARFAGAMAGLGLGPGDTAAIFFGNRIEFIETVWGQAWYGGIAVPINPDLVGNRLQYVLDHCTAKVLVVDAARVETVSKIAADLPHLQHVIVVGDGEYPTWAGVSFWKWPEFIGSASPVPAGTPAISDPLLVMYTSGTTGLSKGVVYSHHFYYCFGATQADGQEMTDQDHLYTPLPLCHAAAHFSCLMAGFSVGARVTVRERFSASNFWEDVGACGATRAMIIGAMGAILTKRPPSPVETQHNLRTIGCVPPPCDPADFERRFKAKLLWQAWGMTEGNFASRTLYQAPKPLDCIGRASALFDIEVLDENDAAVPHDGVSVGELCARPRLPFVMMSGYLNNPEATVAATRNLWFHTGDLGSMDAEGYLYFRGRKKDSLRRRGENVSAVEVEQEVMSNPAVELAAIFAIPSELGEDDIKLDVVLVSGAELTPETLLDYLRERLAPFMMPRYVQIRDSLPMTASARVEKYRLQKEGLVPGAYFDAGDGRSQPAN